MDESLLVCPFDFVKFQAITIHIEGSVVYIFLGRSQQMWEELQTEMDKLSEA